MLVKATREGLLGQKTSSGYIIDEHVSFVALPSTSVLHRHVRIRNPANGKVCIAEVLDVGPHNEHDDAYVFAGARPLAEQGWHTLTTGATPVRGHTNGAGIDLGQRVWNILGMTDNSQVEWEYVT